MPRGKRTAKRVGATRGKIGQRKQMRRGKNLKKVLRSTTRLASTEGRRIKVRRRNLSAPQRQALKGQMPRALTTLMVTSTFPKGTPPSFTLGAIIGFLSPALTTGAAAEIFGSL